MSNAMTLDREAAVRADAGREVIPMRSTPKRIEVVPLGVFGRTVTAVRFDWKPGDSARCNRCTVCRAFEDVCVLQVGRNVSIDEASRLDVRAIPYQGAPIPQEPLTDSPEASPG